MSWIAPAAGSDGPLATLPGIARCYRDLQVAMGAQVHLPGTSLELCRLRLAQLHHCEPALAREGTPIPEEQRSALALWNSSKCFDDAEKACLAFAEVYAMDVQAVTDELAAEVSRHHGEPGLVALIEALGLYDGAIRLALLWGEEPLAGASESPA